MTTGFPEDEVESTPNPAQHRLLRQQEPAIAATETAMRRRLAARGVQAGDLEDLVAEAGMRLHLAIVRREAAGREPIADMAAFACVVADTTFEEYLRRLRPNWYRLRRRIVYVLDSRQATNPFARWRLGADWLGGLRGWQGAAFRATAAYQALLTGLDAFRVRISGEQRSGRETLPALMVRLFRALLTPLRVDELTTQVAALQEITDLPVESVEALYERAGDSALAQMNHPNAESVVLEKLSSEQTRHRLWQIVTQLPIAQRHALLLGMERDELLLFAPAAGITEALLMSREEFYKLWRSLPLDDRAIADRSGITPKQVSNLRKCARERIARWLAREEPDSSRALSHR
jgi:DNA-directed RNA polymerase specialized sigma24 family protein